MAIASTMPTFSTPFRNVFQIGTIHTLPQTPRLKTLMIFLSTMENSSCKKPKESQNPTIRTIASHHSNLPKIGIKAVKETKTNAMETIIATKSPFALTTNFADIQMPNVATLKIQGEQMPTIKITLAAMSEATTATAATTSRIAITETTKIIKATNNVLTIIRHALNSNGKKVTNNKKLRMIKASTLLTIPNPTMRSSLWKKSTTETTTRIKATSSNKTMYQRLPSVYSPTSLQNDTSTFKP
jgi:hypothetical protein